MQPNLQLEKDKAQALSGLRWLQYWAHTTSRKAGWWTELHTGAPIQVRTVFCEKLALIHGELSEALEGYRKNLQDVHLPHRLSVEVELADAILRILDLAGAMNLDLAGAAAEKDQYNKSRKDHSIQSRLSSTGKKF
jgi:NTP pyrophosphatase (non-canonical NTP hydrolase)